MVFQTRARARLRLASPGHQHGNKNDSACLSLVGVQLPADGVGPAELLLQLAGALHVHGVALLQEAHLPAQVAQIFQLRLVGLHQRFKLVHPVGRVPEGEGGGGGR